MEVVAEEGMEEVIAKVKGVAEASPDPVIVLVGGGSCSGKTTMVAEKIKEYFGGEAVTIELDSYFKGKAFLEEMERENKAINADHPEYVDLPKAAEHLRLLKAGKSIEKPTYDFTKRQAIGKVELLPARIIVIDGIYALHEAVAGLGDLKIFVEASRENRLKRRIDRRRGYEKAQTDEEVVRYFNEFVDPMHNVYILPTKKSADVIVLN